MTLLSAAIGLVVGFLLAGTADLSSAAGALFCGIGAAIGCLVASDVISGAGRREGGAGALGFLVGLAALIVAAISILLPALAFLLIVALVWLGVARHRRSQKKHAGLRVLR
jgi:chromate transport protein ChrA